MLLVRPRVQLVSNGQAACGRQGSNDALAPATECAMAVPGLSSVAVVSPGILTPAAPQFSALSCADCACRDFAEIRERHGHDCSNGGER